MTAKAGASLNTNLLWEAIDWLAVETSVSRLQARIVKAVQEKRWNKVKALQRLLTHSVSGKLSAVRRVTENDGKRTPGIDGDIWNTSSKKLQGVVSLRQRGYRPRPLRRIYIPKANGKLRPLGSRQFEIGQCKRYICLRSIRLLRRWLTEAPTAFGGDEAAQTP